MFFTKEQVDEGRLLPPAIESLQVRCRKNQWLRYRAGENIPVISAPAERSFVVMKACPLSSPASLTSAWKDATLKRCPRSRRTAKWFLCCAYAIPWFAGGPW